MSKDASGVKSDAGADVTAQGKAGPLDVSGHAGAHVTADKSGVHTDAGVDAHAAGKVGPATVKVDGDAGVQTDKSGTHSHAHGKAEAEAGDKKVAAEGTVSSDGPPTGTFTKNF